MNEYAIALATRPEKLAMRRDSSFPLKKLFRFVHDPAPIGLLSDGSDSDKGIRNEKGRLDR